MPSETIATTDVIDILTDSTVCAMRPELTSTNRLQSIVILNPCMSVPQPTNELSDFDAQLLGGWQDHLIWIAADCIRANELRLDDLPSTLCYRDYTRDEIGSFDYLGYTITGSTKQIAIYLSVSIHGENHHYFCIADGGHYPSNFGKWCEE